MSFQLQIVTLLKFEKVQKNKAPNKGIMDIKCPKSSPGRIIIKTPINPILSLTEEITSF